MRSKLGACAVGLLVALAPMRVGAADILVKRFASGAGENAVGIVEASQDTEIDGPQALTSDENGELYLLDQVNGRIVQFDPKAPAAQPHILEFPDRLQPTDLIVRKADILVWDGAIHTFQPSADSGNTRGLEELNTRAADDETVVSAFAQMGSSPPGDASELLSENTRAAISHKPQPRPRQYVASRSAGSLVIDVVPVGDQSAARIEVRHQGDADNAPIAQLAIRVRDRLGAVEFLEVDRTGRMFVFAENIPVYGGTAAAFVARYGSGGALEGVYELPLSNTPLSRRFVTVSSDGDVYFLRTQSGSSEVLGVGFRPLAAGKIIDVHVAAVASSTLRGKGPIAAVRPLTRQRVIETAFAFEGIQWQVNPGAYGNDPDTVCAGLGGRIRRPYYLQGKQGQLVRGIPYCWGCHGSLDLIRGKIERGVLAGNICTRNAPRSDATGVDCSAFVSAAWGLATHFTTMVIPAITEPVTDPLQMRPGDAFDKPGSHVMLFLRFTPARMVEVMESSPGACNGRVCRNVYPLSSLLARGYLPVRFRALVNDTTVAESVPIEKPGNTQTSRPTVKRPRGH